MLPRRKRPTRSQCGGAVFIALPCHPECADRHARIDARRADGYNGRMSTSPGAASWLFIKGQETIWLLRSDADHLVVCGPGTCREHFRFDADSAMESFQVSFAERLIAGGWILWGID